MSNLRNNTFGESISILAQKNYTEFIAPNDGYLTIYCGDSNGYVRVGINTIGTYLLDTIPNSAYKFSSVFMRKGTRVYIIGDGTSGCYFFTALI